MPRNLFFKSLKDGVEKTVSDVNSSIVQITGESKGEEEAFFQQMRPAWIDS